MFEHISRSTNEYARLKCGRGADSESPETTPRGSRAWKDTTAADIKIFVGILIYMGAVSLRGTTMASNGDIFVFHMGIVRFEQIKRFLHISWPTSRDPLQPQDKRWWNKPLASSFRKAAGQYYHPGPNVSVDETMIRYIP
ncbi:hypothetical protein N7535_009196 [Penicillium sp. DV-2018c]|nr:hypothetical protein N7461_002903 [Penicillium sp. DV-2018c]KAJ5560999.1 hypothetical protein N7535_009196 [Penicillium sp. DV-2018c]